MEPFNAERIEAQVTDNRALSVALREIGRLARVVEEQSGRIESLEVTNVKRYAYPEPDAEPPYRMAEPENVGAVVMGAWFDALFTRFDRELNPWVSLRTGCAYEWVDIPDPQPHQNCVLTADDPEPPVGSVVLDVPAGSVVPSDKGIVCRRDESGWRTAGLSRSYTWAWVTYGSHSVTLLYRGEA